jgi:deazaflavin-dependent oxidoreductase (nitroreductase family)
MAASPPRLISKVFTGIHVLLYRMSEGKVWGKMVGLPVLLLTTTGRKTGRVRTTPVVYLRDGNQYLIAATAGGSDKHPAWFLNLEKQSETSIQVDGKTMRVKVDVTEGDERAQLYERFKAAGDNFRQYQERTNRPIPVIRLQPIGELT